MNIVFVPRAWEDYTYWAQNDRKLLTKINRLVEDVTRHPYTGLGKPEPLKHVAVNVWSRRITQEHRLVYSVVEGQVILLQCRYHY